MNQIKIIAFDADDTLWKNEDFFRDAEREFCELMNDNSEFEDSMKLLFKTEVENLPLYGFGIKAFVLSMVETALKLSYGELKAEKVAKILAIGKRMLNEEVHLLSTVKETLKKLSKSYRLVLATKGDLLDQERKLEKSGLMEYFHHIEVMSDKKVANYQKLINHLDINANELMMVGNSLKSDIMPILELGGYAVFVPYHTTWEYEQASEEDIKSSLFHKIENLGELPKLLQEL